jgi:hypothetical protein
MQWILRSDGHQDREHWRNRFLNRAEAITQHRPLTGSMPPSKSKAEMTAFSKGLIRLTAESHL